MLQPVPLADIEQLSHIRVQREDQISSLVTIFLPTAIQKVSSFNTDHFQNLCHYNIQIHLHIDNGYTFIIL